MPKHKFCWRAIAQLEHAWEHPQHQDSCARWMALHVKDCQQCKAAELSRLQTVIEKARNDDNLR